MKTKDPACKMTSPATLHFKCDTETLDKRMPLSIDGMSCDCGGQTFRVGVAQTSNPCPTCQTHVLHQCQACLKWFCTGCMGREVVAYKLAQGQEIVGGPTARSSN